MARSSSGRSMSHRWRFLLHRVTRQADLEAGGILSAAPAITKQRAVCKRIAFDHFSWTAAFHFFSREENHTRVAATNMKSHFIDGLPKSSDIRQADIVLPKANTHENGSNSSDR